jgi:hypothetical protein
VEEKEAKKDDHLIPAPTSHSNPTAAAAAVQQHVAEWLELDALAAVDGRGLKAGELSPRSLRLSATIPRLDRFQQEITKLPNIP